MSPAPTLRQIAEAVNQAAPFKFAYDWDNVGLQIGDPSASVDAVAVGLEVTDAFIEFALKHHCTALVTHHPLIFRPAKALRTDDPAQSRTMRLIREGLGLIVAHTNLDRVLHGTNGMLAKLLGLEELRVLEPTELVETYKVTVFVPQDHADKLVEAFHRGGGGRIGAYSRCTFRAAGTGTFEGDAGTNPFFGEAGRFERAVEDRLECVVPAQSLQSVLRELRAAHPYEEMAFDVYPLKDAAKPHGLGCIGEFPGPKLAAKDVAARLKQATGTEFVVAVGSMSKSVRRVAIVTGSPGPSIHAARSAQADIVITGELGYHLAMDAADLGMTVLMCGHAASERVFAKPFCELMRQSAVLKDREVAWHPFEKYPEPFKIAKVE